MVPYMSWHKHSQITINLYGLTMLACIQSSKTNGTKSNPVSNLNLVYKIKGIILPI